MALRYGLPLFLEDRTGRLSGSEFVDLYDRMTLSYRRITHDPTRPTYAIFNTASDSSPSVTLEFGAEHSLGTIRVQSFYPPSTKHALIMISSKSRHFVASDGQRYEWRYRYAHDQEWACTNSNGDVVSYYSLKIAGEPLYPGSSGRMLTVEEDFAHLACEMLATAMIMRHIVEYDL